MKIEIDDKFVKQWEQLRAVYGEPIRLAGEARREGAEKAYRAINRFRSAMKETLWFAFCNEAAKWSKR